MNLRRVAIIAAVVTVLLAIDGIYMIAANYHPGDAATNFLHMSDGGTVVLAAVLLLIATAVFFVLSTRQQASAAVSGAKEQASSNAQPEVKGQDA